MTRTLLALLLLAGCGGVESIEVTTLRLVSMPGEAPLEPDQAVPLEMGTQGGFHLSLAAIASSPGTFEIAQRAFADDVLLVEARRRARFELDESGRAIGELPRVVLCPAEVDVLEVPIRIEVTTDEVSVSTTVRPVCDGALCRELCTP